ncbi:hypothetical protein GQ607_009006 [Colletotrichum asianum]|uniref:Uncharacterized protein n=1 Tax=Colletotrichum asianum TaxID=702518 RepID=A0A8H3ZQC6_9PEZI|nr:hypothetical protein GQ607_009006 [Colletotrichum asianum]
MTSARGLIFPNDPRLCFSWLASRPPAFGEPFVQAAGIRAVGCPKLPPRGRQLLGVFLSRMPTMGLGPSLQQIEPNEVQLNQHGSAPHYKQLALGCCEKYMPKWLMGWEPLFSSQRLHIATLSVVWPPFRLKDGISGWLTFSIAYLLC